MSIAPKLETPASAGSLYMARGAEVAESATRPIFTGDILRLSSGGLVAVVQHPCAMRRGPIFVERVLVCEVIVLGRQVPSDWSTGDFARMFLPEFDETTYSVEFNKIAILSQDEVHTEAREGILSQVGVNLQMQRWIYHNARVVVETMTLQEQLHGPFDQADLVGEACADLTAIGMQPQSALNLVDAWFDKPPPGGAVERRLMLNDAQQRSVVRQELRRQTVAWTAKPVELPTP